MCHSLLKRLQQERSRSDSQCCISSWSEAGGVAGSSPERVFLEVIKLEAWDGTGGQCPSLISLEGCGHVQWADGARSARIIYVDQKSNCWLDVKLGEDLPDSCRGLISGP
ncbi:MAG: hypothetical protein CM1200mP39_30490 [Dehalococcoidia bacterium]|nr:MAG: hypothetical protein CM1200mP39_30490 [Dehalococcoidia bacterium]